jgi:hypothetical protein
MTYTIFTNTTQFAAHYMNAAAELMNAVAHYGSTRDVHWHKALASALAAQRDAGTTEEIKLATKMVDAIKGTDNV